MEAESRFASLIREPLFEFANADIQGSFPIMKPGFAQVNFDCEKLISFCYSTLRCEYTAYRNTLEG